VLYGHGHADLAAREKLSPSSNMTLE
jgi:hypothetical protein